tara:strand:+ start:588 stop:815 length:228 start_codon:yes stop_codon:yes gene_type:complete
VVQEVDPGGLEVPISQINAQADDEVAAAPDVLKRPAAQSMQEEIEADAVFSLNWPARQEVQVEFDDAATVLLHFP